MLSASVALLPLLLLLLSLGHAEAQGQCSLGGSGVATCTALPDCHWCASSSPVCLPRSEPCPSTSSQATELSDWLLAPPTAPITIGPADPAVWPANLNAIEVSNGLVSTRTRKAGATRVRARSQLVRRGPAFVPLAQPLAQLLAVQTASLTRSLAYSLTRFALVLILSLSALPLRSPSTPYYAHR